MRPTPPLPPSAWPCSRSLPAALSLNAKLLPHACWCSLCSRLDCKSTQTPAQSSITIGNDSRAHPPRPAPTRMPTKAIPPARDRLQSRLLVWIAAPILYVLAGLVIATPIIDTARFPSFLLIPILVSLAFALLAWSMKAATPAAAASGGVICFLLSLSTTESGSPSRSGLAPLIALFILTSAATQHRSPKKSPRRPR